MFIACDFNCDLRNIRPHGDLSNNLIDIFTCTGVEPILMHYSGDIGYTFHCETSKVHSFIDNIMVPKSFSLHD